MEWNNRRELSDTISPENLKRFNGKELFSEMNLGHYAYGKRFFDPVLGRFVCVDPMAEKTKSYSPYNYGNNNPVLNIDPSGGYAVSVNYKITYDAFINAGYSKKETATAVIAVLQGKDAKLKDGDNLDARGMSANQMNTFVKRLASSGFTGTINFY